MQTQTQMITKRKHLYLQNYSQLKKQLMIFKGKEIDGNRYYDIVVYSTTLTPLKVVRQVGNRLFFDDGTDTIKHSRRILYPKSIDEKTRV